MRNPERINKMKYRVLGTALFVAGIPNDRTSGKPTLMGSFKFFSLL